MQYSIEPTNLEIIGLGRHLINALSKRTEMPLVAICLEHKTRKYKIFLCLGTRDKEGNVWLPSGKVTLRDAYKDDFVNLCIDEIIRTCSIPVEVIEKEFSPSISYTEIKELRDNKWFSGNPGPIMAENCNEILECYISEHSPPTYPGLSAVNGHFFKYLQSECWFYALALASEFNKKPCLLHTDDMEYLHAVIIHNNDTVEDIWGVRKISSIICELPVELRDKVKISCEDFDSVMKESEREAGKKAIRNKVRIAREVMRKNPLHKERNFGDAK